MPTQRFQDAEVSVALFSDDVHVKIRSLDFHMTREQAIELAYPMLDALEKTIVLATTKQIPQPMPPLVTGDTV